MSENEKPSGATVPEAIATVTTYSVSVLPEDDINHDTWSIDVEYHGKGRWALARGRLCLNRLTGRWELEHIPSEREDDWLDAHRFGDLDEALKVAKAMAPFLRINHLTALDVLERAGR